MKIITLMIPIALITANTHADQMITGRLLHTEDLRGYELDAYDGDAISKIYDLELAGNTCGQAITRSYLNPYLNEVVSLSIAEDSLSPGQIDVNGIPHETLIYRREPLSAAEPTPAYRTSPTVVGNGEADSTSPSCDDGARGEAEAAADKDASLQCQGPVKRINEYTVICHVLAHGYADTAQASADYTCYPQL